MPLDNDAVVVGLDGSAASLRALRWAAGHAAAAHRPLHLVHAVPTVASAYADSSRGGRGGTVLTSTAGRVLEQARALVEHDHPGVRVDADRSPGTPAAALVRLSERAGLVVVGSRGLGPLRSTLRGSVGVALLRRSHCPVVVVRPEPRGVTRLGVVVGLEVDPTSTPVLDLAFRMASLRRQPLTLLHGTGAPYVGTTGAYRPVEVAGEGADVERERLAVAETCAGFADLFPDVTVTARSTPGRPERALLEASVEADLLVLGAHRRALPRRVLSGSVSTAVVEHARCTVVVVPLDHLPDGGPT